MARLLWLSDAGCTTGFGNVTHQIGERLVRDFGHDIHVIAVNHRGDDYPSILDPSLKTPLRLYMPTQLLAKDTYGTTRFVELLGKLGETDPGLDAVVILNDPQIILSFLFDNAYDKERVLLQYRPILSYVPCDGTNLPKLWTEMIPKLTNVVAMSKWGQDHYSPSKLVYHGVDTEIFYPVGERPITLPDGTVLRTKRECKQFFGFKPDGFVIGRVDKNSGRKDMGALLSAVMPLMERDTSIELYIHAAASEMAHGINIPVMLSRWPTVESSRVFLPDVYSSFIGRSQAEMNALYNAFDVFVSTSRGEGFGMTLSESLACSVPVIAQNVSAIPEVVGPGGILLEPERLLTVPSGEDVWLANIGAFSEAIANIHESRGARRKLGEAGKEHVRKSFSWDVAAAKFHEYISGLSQAASPTEEVSHG